MSESGWAFHEPGQSRTDGCASPSAAELTRTLIGLSALHAETEETARLCALAEGSARAATILAALAGPLALGVREGAVAALWLFLVLGAAATIYAGYRLTVRSPFCGLRLRKYPPLLGGLLQINGLAWGLAAFVLLPAQASVLSALPFLIVPALTLTAVLREWEATAAFLLPAGLLVAFASVLHPFAEGTLGAGATVACAGGLYLLARLKAMRRTAAPVLRLPVLADQSSSRHQ